MTTSTTNLDFTFDVIDKRFVQISSKLVTAGDRLIYARMANEFKLFKDSPKGYTPSNTSLAVVGCYADESSARKSLKRLEAVGLITKLETKSRQACRYLVNSIDEALKINPDLLALPDMATRRDNGMKLEAKGYKHKGNAKKSHYGSKTRSEQESDQVNAESTTVLTTPDYGSETCTTTVLRPVDYGSETPHERTHKEKEKELKRRESEDQIHNIESQGQGLSRDDDSLSPKAHIVEDDSDQIMSTEEEESKPVVIQVTPPDNDDEDYFEADSDLDSIDDDEETYHKEQRSEERNNQIIEHFSTQQKSTAPTREDYLQMLSGNRVKQYKHNPAKPAWM